MSDKKEVRLRSDAVRAAKEYFRQIHVSKNKPFRPQDRISYSGRVFDESEIEELVNASLDFWLTAGDYADEFEKGLSKYLGIKYCSLVNSGSSANLLAIAALTAAELKERRIKKGDEVITLAAGFPTTVTPIIQYGAVPVFVDIGIPSYNADPALMEKVLSSKTKAVMFAHTLGNPFDIRRVKKFCDKNGLWLIEDNCDALGSRYLLNGKWGYTGTFGDIGTSSFYPPHHITMGEGGAVYTNNPLIRKLVESYRDWGRDCLCPSGKDNTCGKRFSRKYGELPFGYDHKYVYSHFGYNLKATDLQAAIGCAQLKKLPGFVKARKRNWKILLEGLKGMEEYFILPEAAENSDPSWFGFMITVRKGAGISRQEIVHYLESRNIQTRMLFAGNITKHPCFNEMRKNKKGFRISGELKNTDIVMNDSFWLGVYPGMKEGMIEYMIDQIKQGVKR